MHCNTTQRILPTGSCCNAARDVCSSLPSGNYTDVSAAQANLGAGALFTSSEIFNEVL